MSGMLIDTTRLSETLHQYIKTSTVRVFQEQDKLVIVPQAEGPNYKYNCRFFGLLEGESGMVEEILADRKNEKLKGL